jgi:hypothetical protein
MERTGSNHCNVDNDGTVTGVLEGKPPYRPLRETVGQPSAHIIVEARKALSLDGAHITIADKM